MIKHDAQGFLVGEVLDMSRQLIGGQREGLDSLARIERAISRMAAPPRSRARVAAADGVAVQPALRRSGSIAPAAVGRVAGQAAAEVALRAARSRDLAGSPITEPVLQRASARAIAAQVATRDARGRFVSGQARAPGSPSSPGSGSGGEGDGPDQGGRVGEALKQLAGNLKDVTGNATQNIDPTIQAATEIRNVVEPLGRGLSLAAGRRKEQKQERWWRRIYRALTDRRRPDQGGATVVRAGHKDGGILDGATGGVVVSLVGKILPVLGAILLPILGVVGAMLAGLGIGKLIYGWLESSGITAKFFDAIDSMKEGLASLGKKASDTWESTKQGARDAYQQVRQAPQKAAAAASKAAKAANDAIKERTGVDMQAEAAKGYEIAKERIGGLAESIASRLPDSLKRGAVLLREAVAAGITSPRKLANFMGQMHHESGGFRRMEENLNYSPERLMSVFKGKFKSINDARAVAAGGPRAIAERIYGGRMGNAAAGDGYKYRGRGFIQLTGKDNYAAASKALGIDLVNNPDMAADPAVAAKIAAWYWGKRVAGRGMDGSVDSATRAINGGKNGLQDRRDKAAMYERLLADSPAVARLSTAAVPSAKAPQASAAKAASVSAPVVVEVPTKLNRDQERAITVKVPREVGQNLGDRGIAHVVTGGLGGG